MDAIKQQQIRDAQTFLKACKEAAEPYSHARFCDDVRAQLNGTWTSVIARRQANFKAKISNFKHEIK